MKIRPLPFLALDEKFTSFLVNGEAVRLLVLGALVLYDCRIFVENIGANIGAGDARFYQYILRDAIIQLNAGFFPTYLGQSLYDSVGNASVLAPYYVLLGQALNALTLNSLNSLHIQHLMVIFSALLGAYLFYYLLSRLAPNFRWAAVCFAYFYVSCPGVLGLIHYRLDAYYSFMALPFIPMAFYGLIKAYSDGDSRGYVITGVALSLAWMAHAPIAGWTATVCILFLFIQIVLKKRGLAGLLIIGMVVFFLNLWQFTAIFTLKFVDISGDFAGYARAVTRVLRSDFPASLFPLGYAEKVPGATIPFIQLGYALWFAVGLGILVSAGARRNALMISLLLCLTSLFLFVYPLPVVGEYLWDALPGPTKTMTFFWPQQRLYMVIAALSSLVGMLAFADIARNHSKWIKNVVFSVLALFVCWNVYQVRYIHASETTSVSNINLWSVDQNPYFFGRFIFGSQQKMPFEGEYNPSLKNRLLDSNKKPIAASDNEAALSRKCLDQRRSASTRKLFEPSSPERFSIGVKRGQDGSRNLGMLMVSEPATHLLLCLKISAAPSGELSLKSPVAKFDLVAGSNHMMNQRILQAGADEQVVLLPFHFAQPYAGPLTFYFRAGSEDTVLTATEYGVLRYTAADLPIRVDSHTPYRSIVMTPSDNVYLEVFKLYRAGYRALVNDEVTPVLESPTSTILVPLKREGANRVELSYVGTTAMRTTFWISLIAWLLVLLYFYKARWRGPMPLP